MAVSMRRMNGSCRGMALALVLCALLLHNEVHCQDSTDATDTQYTPNATDALGAAPTDATGLGVTAFTDDNKGTDASVEPQTPVNDADNTVADSITDSTANITAGTSTPVSDQDTAFTSTVSENDPLARGDTSVTTAEPGVATQGTEATVTPVSPVVPETEAPVVLVLQPAVECVDKEAVKDKDSVKVELSSESSCSETKRIMQDSAWCTGDCNLQLFQEENSKTLVLTRANGEVKELSENLNSQGIKGQLGVVESAPRWVKHSSTVLVSLLITGLLLAAGLIGGYCLKKHSRHNAKCMRLAEEVYPVDEENQGNTLVSVAPLNPIETLEKPANGDSQEATKTQPPPTNGHSTTKTADTEL